MTQTKSQQRRQSNEKQQTIPGMDSPLANACDEYLNIKSEIDKQKEALAVVAEKIIQLLQVMGQKSVRHQGYLFTVQELEARFRLTLKEAPEGK